jgi:hypothetical protein
LARCREGSSGKHQGSSSPVTRTRGGDSGKHQCSDRSATGPCGGAPGKHHGSFGDMGILRIDGSACAPVDACGGPGQERLVDQLPAQGAVVVEDRLEDLVDDRLRIPATRLERPGHLVKQQPPAGALSRYGGDPAVADESPPLMRRVSEKASSILLHRLQYDSRTRTGHRWHLAGQRDVPGGTVSRVARYDDDLRFAHVGVLYRPSPRITA